MSIVSSAMQLEAVRRITAGRYGWVCGRVGPQ